MGNICIIGPRGSGKTTYLAALAYWPQASENTEAFPRFNVQAVSEDASKLKDKADRIIRQGAAMKPTEIDGIEISSVDDLPYYLLRLEVTRRFRQPEPIDLAVRDYPGEVFHDLSGGQRNALYQEFISESLAADVVGCMVMLPDWEPGTDEDYSRMVDHFLMEMDTHNRLGDLRLAVVMSKCERGEIWPGRLDPSYDLFGVHLPRTRHLLRAKMPEQNLRFFALSTFGVLGAKDPRPNRMDEGQGAKGAILRRAHPWRPYGMLAPLYWLSTGHSLNSHV